MMENDPRTLPGTSNTGVPLRSIFVIFVSVVCLLVAGAYCWANESGHASEDPRRFGFLLALLVLMAAGKAPSNDHLSIAALILSISSMASCWLMVEAQIMMPYEEWLVAGMPPQNPNAKVLILGYCAATLLLCFTSLRLSSKQNPPSC